MTPADHLRHLHQPTLRKWPVYRKTGTSPAAFTRARDIEALIETLPQLAAVVEAADALAYAADNAYVPEGYPHDENLYEAERRCTIALAELTQALA